MPRIDFYIIPETTSEAKFRFACRVIEKAYEQQRHAYIHVDTTVQAYQMNDLLWTFHDTSFIPHGVVGEKLEIEPTILIGYSNKPQNQNDIIFNLTESIPDFVTDFDRIVEIVLQDEQAQKKSREHFRFYKEKGYEINTHDLRK